MADYFRDRLKLKSGESPGPSESPRSEGDEAYSAPRGGLGASRGIGMKGEDGEVPKMGLGMSKFGSLMSGAFLSSLSVEATAGEGKASVESAEDEAERKARRKAEKKAKREVKEVQQLTAENYADLEEKALRKAAKKAKREAKEQSTLVEDTEALEKAQRKAEKEARKKRALGGEAA